ncbi:hypothetical protein GGR56DRAFT_196947 [Xylariaceae sp. FL0804]|nr:hypothetical protein GGR56DRAFT_196947 [Xylariaceae sp. FL0804]
MPEEPSPSPSPSPSSSSTSRRSSSPSHPSYPPPYYLATILAATPSHQGDTIIQNTPSHQSNPIIRDTRERQTKSFLHVPFFPPSTSTPSHQSNAVVMDTPPASDPGPDLAVAPKKAPWKPRRTRKPSSNPNPLHKLPAVDAQPFDEEDRVLMAIKHLHCCHQGIGLQAVRFWRVTYGKFKSRKAGRHVKAENSGYIRDIVLDDRETGTLLRWFLQMIAQGLHPDPTSIMLATNDILSTNGKKPDASWRWARRWLRRQEHILNLDQLQCEVPEASLPAGES